MPVIMETGVADAWGMGIVGGTDSPRRSVQVWRFAAFIDAVEPGDGTGKGGRTAFASSRAEAIAVAGTAPIFSGRIDRSIIDAFRKWSSGFTGMYRAILLPMARHGIAQSGDCRFRNAGQRPEGESPEVAQDQKFFGRNFS